LNDENECNDRGGGDGGTAAKTLTSARSWDERRRGEDLRRKMKCGGERERNANEFHVSQFFSFSFPS
jgi:hypothetical protein